MTQPAPDDAADRGRAAEVSHVSDEQWLAGHRALFELGDDVIPRSELAYLYDPGREPATVTPADLTPDPGEPGEVGRG